MSRYSLWKKFLSRSAMSAAALLGLSSTANANELIINAPGGVEFPNEFQVDVFYDTSGLANGEEVTIIEGEFTFDSNYVSQFYTAMGGTEEVVLPRAKFISGALAPAATGGSSSTFEVLSTGGFTVPAVTQDAINMTPTPPITFPDEATNTIQFTADFSASPLDNADGLVMVGSLMFDTSIVERMPEVEFPPLFGVLGTEPIIFNWTIDGGNANPPGEPGDPTLPTDTRNTMITINGSPTTTFDIQNGVTQRFDLECDYELTYDAVSSDMILLSVPEVNGLDPLVPDTRVNPDPFAALASNPDVFDPNEENVTTVFVTNDGGDVGFDFETPCPYSVFYDPIISPSAQFASAFIIPDVGSTANNGAEPPFGVGDSTIIFTVEPNNTPDTRIIRFRVGSDLPESNAPGTSTQDAFVEIVQEGCTFDSVTPLEVNVDVDGNAVPADGDPGVQEVEVATTCDFEFDILYLDENGNICLDPNTGLPMNPVGVPDWITDVTVDTTPDMTENGVSVTPATEVSPGDSVTSITYVAQPNTGPCRTAVIVFYTDNDLGNAGITSITGDMSGGKLIPNANLDVNGAAIVDFHFINQDDGCEVLSADTTDDTINKDGLTVFGPSAFNDPPAPTLPGMPFFEVEISNALCTNSMSLNITEVDEGDGTGFFAIDFGGGDNNIANVVGVQAVATDQTQAGSVTYRIPYSVDPNIGPERNGSFDVTIEADMCATDPGVDNITTSNHFFTQQSGCDILSIDPEITNPPVPVGGDTVTFDINISAIDCPVNVRSLSACDFVTLDAISNTTGFSGATSPPNELGVSASALTMTASLTVDPNPAATPRACVLLITSDCEEDVLMDLGFDPATITDADLEGINEMLDMMGMPPLNTFTICQEGDGAIDAWFEEDDDQLTPKFREVVFNADFNEGIINVDVTPTTSTFTISNVPEWVTLKNRDNTAPPVFDTITGPDADGFFEYTATGDQEFAFHVASSDIGTSRIANLILTPGNTDIIEACASVFDNDFTSLTIKQSADCLYTINPFENTLEAGDSVTTPTVPAIFDVVTNGASDSITGCTWRVSVSSNTPWLRLVDDVVNGLDFSDPNFVGEDDATVLYEADWNPGPARTGTIQVATENGIIVHTVIQESNCSYTLWEQGTMLTDVTVPASGGSVDLEAIAPELCQWTIIENASWLEIMFGSGQTATDTGTEVFDVNVDRNVGPARFTTVFLVDPLTNVVAQVVIRQEAGCSVTIDSFAANFPAQAVPSGALLTNSILVTSSDLCEWTASESSDWVSIVDPTTGLTTGTSVTGFGIGQVIYIVEPNPGPARTTTIQIGAIAHTITQASGCDVEVSQDFFSVASAATTETVNLTLSDQDCEWTATSNVPWITVVPTSGTGDDSISLIIDENLSIERVGTVTVVSDSDSQDTEIITVVQANGCDISISDDAMFDQLGGSGTGTITFTDPNNLVCDWEAVSTAPWLTITSDSNGSGAGFLSYEVSPFQSPVIRQAEIIVSTNSGLSTDSITITQMDECQVILTADQSEFKQDGGTTSIDVDFPNANDAVCDWEATTDVAWIQITGDQNGLGDSEFSITVSPYNGATTRTGTVTVTLPNGAFDTVTITQTDCCDVIIASTEDYFNQAGGSGDVAVSFDETLSSPSANEFCDWTAETNVSWIVINSDSNGDGPGFFSFTVSPWNSADGVGGNNPDARTGTIIVSLPNGDVETITITQEDLCDVTLSSTDDFFNQAGGSGEVTVAFADLMTSGVASDNDFCDWTVQSDVPWIVVESDSNGTGPGFFSFTVASWNSPDGNGGNNPDTRMGTITVTLPNGDTEIISITQQDLCDVTLVSTDLDFDQAGGTGDVSVTFADLLSTQGLASDNEFCDWTLESDSSWLVINNSNGEGPGTFEFTVSPWNFVASLKGGPPANSRQAVITVTLPNGDTDSVTVTQTDLCDVSIAASDLDYNQNGGNGEVTVSFASNAGFDDANLEFCDWTASSSAGWLVITSDSNGEGPDVLSYTVAPWQSADGNPANNNDSRSATITVSLPNGDTDTVTITQTDECDVDVVDNSYSFDQRGGDDVIQLVFQDGGEFTCDWQATVTSGNQWIELTGDTNGTGEGTVSFRVSEFFLGGTRNGTIEISVGNGDSVVVDVMQTDECVVVAVPNAAAYDQSGADGEFLAEFGDSSPQLEGEQIDCPWTVLILDENGNEINADWISINGSSEGTGTSLISYTVNSWFDSPGPGSTRTAIIRVELTNGLFADHVVSQTDFCEHVLDADTIVFDSEGGLSTFNVDFLTDQNNDTQFECPWIVRVTYLDDNGQPLSPQPAQPDEWIQILEGSTEGHGDGLVTFNVEEFLEFGETRQADICVILDNGFEQCVRIIQEDECELIVSPDKFFFDHNGVLTGPLFDEFGNPLPPSAPFDDNTGTAFFDIDFVDPESRCDFTVEVGPDSQWIQIVNVTNEEDEEAQVFFEIDPNVVPGPDVERIGTIIVTGENGQIEIVTICQSEGFELLEQFELADPALASPNPENPVFGFGMNNVVIGYTDLSDYTVQQDGQPDADFFTVFDPQTQDRIQISLDVSADQRGFLSGIATLQLIEGTFDNETDPELKSTSPSESIDPIEVPVTGTIKYSRVSRTSIETADNNYSGRTDVQYQNRFTLQGSTLSGNGQVRIEGREVRTEFGLFTPSNSPIGFDVRVDATATQGVTSATGSDRTARLLGWNPTTANLAFSKNSFLSLNESLTEYTADMLILNSDYSSTGQQGFGKTNFRHRFAVGNQPGAYELTGEISSNPIIRMSSRGKHFIFAEDFQEEGFNFDKFDRGVNLFNESTTFSNGQVTIQGTNRWVNGTIDPPSSDQ